jgi:hypothetical protein
MFPSTTLSRPVFVRAAALPLTFLFAVTLASAATPADAPIADTPLAVAPVELVETPEMDGAAVQPASCGGAESEDALFTPVDLDPFHVTPASRPVRPPRGYCRCSCSFTPDCSTNADCGGGLCLKGPTCC